MSIAKNQKKTQKEKKNKISTYNQAFAIYYSKNFTVSSSKRMNIWGSGKNSAKASERELMRHKGIITTTSEPQQKWKRRKNGKSIQLRIHHNKANFLEMKCFLESNKLCIKLKNNIINFTKINHKEKKKSYYRYKIWKIVRKYDAGWKEKRYKNNPLTYIGKDLLINPPYFQFCDMYRSTLNDVDKGDITYCTIKKAINTFEFLAEKYVVWFLDTKKEDRAKHLLIYKLTKNLLVFNKK